MKKRFTQKEKELTRQLVKEFGYWSDEFQRHLETYHPFVWEKVHVYAIQIFKNN